MDFSPKEILATLTAVLGSVMAVAYQVEKKNGINGLTCLLLCAGMGVFWLIVFYSIYFLVGSSLEMFGQPRAPYLIRVLWPEALLPYAPLVASLFAWSVTTRVLPYWIRHENETEEERHERLTFFVNQARRHAIFLGKLYILVWLLVQFAYRCPLAQMIPLPTPL